MQDWLEFVVTGLVDHPGDVVVSQVEQGDTVVYELRLHPDDVGKIIGRRGATINALRALVQVGGSRRGERATVDVVEDDVDQD
ncbi:MAG: KH domain-containing protein [Verrucomicrobiales bacterium]|nr:KH domain-containing protein [Verrucomicrobiales bacterium]